MKLPDIPQEFKQELDRAGYTEDKVITVVMMCYDHYEFEFDQCIADLERNCRKKGYILYKHRTRATDVEKGRYDAIQKGFYGKWLFFLDSDQVVPEDTLMRLIEHDVPICGTLVVGKVPPHLVVTAQGTKEEGMRPLLDWPANALIEVDATGFGCCVIRRDVFETFPDYNPFLKIFCPTLKDSFGEDWSFCIRAKEHGFPIHVDTSIVTGHIGKYVYTLGDFELWRDRVHISEEGKPYFHACTHPKLVKRLQKDPKMEQILVLGDPNSVNPYIEVRKRKPAAQKGLILMGETNGSR